MKDLQQQRPKLPYQRTYLTVMALVIFLPAIWFGFSKFVDWNEKHYFQKQDPITLKVQAPIVVKEREETKVVEKRIAPIELAEIDTPIKTYICNKFGPYDCKIALGIVQAESGFNDQAINVNENGSVDLGCWQINFPTHIKRISPHDALDCEKATDVAYEIFKEQGFQPWVAFTTNRYLAFINE